MSQISPPPAALQKLPVMATVSEAYGRVLGNLPLLCAQPCCPS